MSNFYVFETLAKLKFMIENAFEVSEVIDNCYVCVPFDMTANKER